jgi:hypothetical protein
MIGGGLIRDGIVRLVSSPYFPVATHLNIMGSVSRALF